MQHACSCKSLTKIVNTAVVGMWLLFRGYSEGRSSLLIGIWISLFLISESKQWDFDLISSVQLFSHVQLFVTPLTAAHQASLSVTNSPSLLKFTSIESDMSLSNEARYKLFDELLTEARFELFDGNTFRCLVSP